MSLALTRCIALRDSDSTVLTLAWLVAVRYGFHRDELYFLEPTTTWRSTSTNRYRYVRSGSSDGSPKSRMSRG